MSNEQTIVDHCLTFNIILFNNVGDWRNTQKNTVELKMIPGPNFSVGRDTNIRPSHFTVLNKT